MNNGKVHECMQAPRIFHICKPYTHGKKKPKTEFNSCNDDGYSVGYALLNKYTGIMGTFVIRELLAAEELVWCWLAKRYSVVISRRP